MKRINSIWKPLLMLTAIFVLLQSVPTVKAAENHDELFVLIGDSLMKAKDGDRAAIAKNMREFQAEWTALNKADSKQGNQVSEKVKQVQRLLQDKNTDNGALSKSLSELSSAVVKYDQELNPADKEKAKDQVKNLLPILAKMQDSIKAGEATALNSQYQQLMNEWTASEKLVHDESLAAYGNIEKYMALIRIAITQEPADLQKADTNILELTSEVESFLAGKTAKQAEGDYTLSDVTALLTKAEEAIPNKKFSEASVQLNEILTIWPMVEGDVQTRDSKLYSDMETKIPAAVSLLNSKKVESQQALDIVKNLNSRLAPLTSKTDYSFWDAALILLREGLEALLIVVTLMAFLKKTGQQSQQKWIWTGVASGILASAALAIIINIVFSKLTAAASREYIEGITGIVAVAMMLTVGAWLHNKSRIGSWNKYIKEQMQDAIARGSLFSFAFISFLSVFREGAETIIFYAGITPYISLQQLVLGVVLAIVILAVVGFAITTYSVKIPIGFFFKAATLLIYFLAFKILGISIHALQVSNVIQTSTVENLPFIDWLGLYPTWETTLSQVLLLAVIASMTWLVKNKAVRVNA